MGTDTYSELVAQAPAGERERFIRQTYLHLAGAVLAFIVVEWLLLQWSGADALAYLMTRRYAWLLVLLAFMAASSVAERWARSDTSPGTQYLGLGLHVVAGAVIVLPLLYVAAYFGSPAVIPTAGALTALLVAGLTFAAFTSGADFSFRRGALTIGSFVALGLIVASILFGFTLGLAYSFFAIALACGFILYDTSNVIHHFRTDQHVAAALELLCSIAGVKQRVAEVILAEVGPDMRQFPSASHLCSWAAICPGNNQSGGRQRSGRTRRGNRWLKGALLQAAWAATRVKDGYLAAQFRRLAKRRGEKRAAVAVAHSILRLVYRVLTTGSPYQELGAAYSDQQEADQRARYHLRRLAELGYAVAPEPRPAA